MQPFYVANELLNDEGALRRRFELDGYLFLKQMVEPGKLLQLRRQIADRCARQLWFKPGSDPMDAIAWTTAKGEGEEDYFKVYDEVQRLEDFHALAHDDAILSVMRKLLGETAFPHPLSIARLMFPDTPEWFTPPHQDYPNNQGTENLYACWMPLSDCPVSLGNLSVLAGSHRRGLLLPLDYALGPGNRQIVLDERVRGLTWHGGDFHLGDMIVFHSLTVHRSLPNETDRLRISVDYRFQREGEPLTEGCLHPHFRRTTWDEIYRNWSRDGLKYYWKRKSFPIADWTTMHDLPEEHLLQGTKQQTEFDRQRAERSAKYPRAKNLAPAAEGVLDGISGDRVLGWAWHPSHPDMDAVVELVAGDQLVATAIAALAREDLKAAGKRNGRCGFEIPMDSRFPVHVPMVVRMRLTDGTYTLPGGPVVLDGTPAPPMPTRFSVPLNHRHEIVGHLDEFGPEVVRGWVWYNDPKQGPVSVSLRDGETEILSFVAESWRDELAEFRRGDGRCGFAVALPDDLRDGKVHTIDLRLAGSASSLLRQPLAFRWVPGTSKEAQQADQRRPESRTTTLLDQNAQVHLQAVYVKQGLYRNTAWAGTPVRLAPVDLINIQTVVNRVRPSCIVTTSTDDGLIAYLASIRTRLGLVMSKIVRIVPVAPTGAPLVQVHSIVGHPYHAATLAAVRRAIGAAEDVLVLFEPQKDDYLSVESIRTYAGFVSYGSYFIFLGTVFGQPWLNDSKYRHVTAIQRFIEQSGSFAIDETMERRMVVSLCVSGYLKRVRDLHQAQKLDSVLDLVAAEGRR